MPTNAAVIWQRRPFGRLERSSTSASYRRGRPSAPGLDPAVLHRNAVEHGGDVVTVGPLNDGFFVADDGPGIPEAIREQIFEPGFSAEQSGTGYGLLIVSEVVDAHGWSVSVTESEHGGARFEITGVDVES